MKLRYWLYWLLPFTLLASCTTPDPIIHEKIVKVQVPVHTSCVSGKRPEEPVALRDRIPRAEWDAMTTDQRENLGQAAALDRKIYGDRLTVVTAGCD